MVATSNPARGSAPSPRFDLKAKTKSSRPPPRLVLYTEPGFGKTTFACSAPDVVLIPTEDGALATEVPRLPNEGKCETWEQLLTAVRVLVEGEHAYKWAVIDTLNNAEALCATAVCERDFGGLWTSRNGKEGFDSYGKGERGVGQEMKELLKLLDVLQQRRGVGVILLAHEGLHKQGNALGADFQKFGANVNKHTWALVTAWADQIGHGMRDLVVRKEKMDKAAKAGAIGNERWIYFEGGPGQDAKARVGYEMPEKILLSWEDYAAALNADRVGELVTQALKLAGEIPEEQRAKTAVKLGGEITAETLRAIGKTKLTTLIGWMLDWTKKSEGGV